ncbi:MAG TPA: caspase family protein, partial [Rhodocyclaceae bacterium]|nr:caspase family protein [Rhodocyclaceae bacterium]
EAEVEKVAVQANMVMRYMEDSKNRVNLVVLDACRNNPFIKTRSLKTRGLAPMDAPSGSLIAFSTAPGTEASDGSGRNGLYTKYLMANVKVPGLTVEQVFKRTREGVEAESERDLGRKQSPREESSLKGGDMYFVAPPDRTATADPAAVELAYWNSIANSTNPADFESYLNQYPNGRFSELAKNRLAATRSKTAMNNQSRAVGDDPVAGGVGNIGTSAPPQQQQRVASAKSGTGVYSSNGFSFSEGEGGIKAAEFLSISCRDYIKNKRVRVDLTDKGGTGAPFRQALLQKLRSIGVKVAAAGAAADVVLKGVIETSAGVNRTLGINEVDLDGDFSLATAAGKTVSTASLSGGAYADRNIKNAARDVFDEKSEEIVGKLFQDYCAGR